MSPRSKSSQRERVQRLLDEVGVKKPSVPVERVAKHLGIQVRYSPLDDEMSGMIYIKDDVPIIGVNALHHPNRQRFTIAHEIGHFVLHRELLTGQIHVDHQFPILMRDAEAALGTSDIEIEANNFAAELLVPEAMLVQAIGNKASDIDDDGPVVELAAKFKVSKQMMGFRIRNLG